MESYLMLLPRDILGEIYKILYHFDVSVKDFTLIIKNSYETRVYELQNYYGLQFDIDQVKKKLDTKQNFGLKIGKGIMTLIESQDMILELYENLSTTRVFKVTRKSLETVVEELTREVIKANKLS